MVFLLPQSIHSSLLERRIVHVDMDAFYAAVEIRDDPSLRGKPVVVGGKPGGRGVVATCSYEARSFGIHSAMSSSKAYQLCPDAIFVRPRFDVYKAVSDEIRNIFARYTSLVEPLSLDEAYLDLTYPTQKTATQLASEIRAAIFKELGLTASAGIAPNKMLAKIAGEIKKPNGQTTITPAQVSQFMAHLEVGKIPGVGPKTKRRLAEKGILYCRDVLKPEHGFLGHHGRFERWLYHRCQGLDDRPVSVSRVRKSIGHEETFSADLSDGLQLSKVLIEIAKQLEARLRKNQMMGRVLTLKIKYSDFSLSTRSLSFNRFFQDFEAILSASEILLQRTLYTKRSVRLLGLSLSDLSPIDPMFSETPFFFTE